MEKEKILKDLQKIPGLGKSISVDLYNLGITAVTDLKNRDPETLYLQLCDLSGVKVDRCMLYVFRCAVYYASNREYDSEKLKWWNWKD
jgi:hypothetical protein